MKIRMYITQATANYFLAAGVKFKAIKANSDEYQLEHPFVEVTIESGIDVYNIFDAGRFYGRDLPKLV